jgi:hypothetical protein
VFCERVCRFDAEVFFLDLTGVGEVTLRFFKAVVMSSRGDEWDLLAAEEDDGVGSDSAGTASVPIAATCGRSGDDGDVSDDVEMPIAIVAADFLGDRECLSLFLSSRWLLEPVLSSVA